MEFLESKKDNYRVMGTFQGGNNFFQGLLYVTIIVFGGLFIANGDLNPIVLATFALYINVFVSPIEVLVEFTEMFQKGFSGFRRFEEVMNEIPEIQDAKDAKDLKDVSGNIDFDHVSFQYNDNEKVIDDVNLHIKAGEKIALVGPSGSGKTTLCSLLSRFYDVTNGSISIDDQNIKDVTLKSLRSNIGLVQQDVYLFTGTIEQNIAYGRPNASHEEIVKAAKKANIHDFIMSLPKGYNTIIKSDERLLSDGQKQLLAIARALLTKSEILLFDEVTSNIDPTTTTKVSEILKDLKQDHTIIMVTHKPEMMDIADRVIVLDKGKVVCKGTNEDVFSKNALYRDLKNRTFASISNNEI